jgi:hypothetical protein
MFSGMEGNNGQNCRLERDNQPSRLLATGVSQS